MATFKNDMQYWETGTGDSLLWYTHIVYNTVFMLYEPTKNGK